jgi:predicted  nucleic acid-binding Zn-ribbon protein
MTEALVSALEGRVTHLETALTQSLARIEGLIRQEIQDLKTEQLSDIKKTIERVERDLKTEFSRLATDQGRLWDRITDLEKRDNLRTGSSRAIDRMWNFFSALLGGAIAISGSWLSSGKPPHP